MRILNCATPAHHRPPDLNAPKTRLRPRRLDPSFGANASIQSFCLTVDLLVSLRLGVGDGRRSDSGGMGDQGPEEVAERPSQAPTEVMWMRRSQAGTSTRGAEGAARAWGCVATRREACVGSGGFPR